MIPAPASAPASDDHANNATVPKVEEEYGTASPAIIVMDEIVDHAGNTVGEYTGQVKWWNDKLGFGFATICEGRERGRDIFVHHTGIRPVSSNYCLLYTSPSPRD